MAPLRPAHGLAVLVLLAALLAASAPSAASAPTFTTSFVARDKDAAVSISRVLSFLHNLTVAGFPQLPAAVTAGNVTIDVLQS